MQLPTKQAIQTGTAHRITGQKRNARGLMRSDYPSGACGTLAFNQGWPVWGATPDAMVDLGNGRSMTVREMFAALATG